MRKIVLVVVLMSFVFSLAVMGYAAEKGNKPNLAAGAVKAIDVKAKTITLMADKKPDFTCSLNDKTVIRSNSNQKVTFDDIKVGNIIVLIYEVVDGKNIATTVTVAGQIAAPAADKKG